jgi:chromosome segregation ATPase
MSILRDKFQKLDSQLQIAVQEKNSAVSQSLAKDKSLYDLQKSHASLKQKLEKSEKLAATFHDRISAYSALQKRLEDAEKQLAKQKVVADRKLVAESDSLASQVRAITYESDTIKIECENLSASLAKAKHEKKELKLELSHIVTQMQTLKDEHKIQNAKLKEEIIELSKRSSKLSDTVLNQKQEFAQQALDMKNDYSEKQERFARTELSFDRQKQAYLSKLGQLEVELEKMQTLVLEKETFINQQAAKLDSAEKSSLKLNLSLKDKLDEKDKFIQAELAKNSALDDLVHQLQSTLSLNIKERDEKQQLLEESIVDLKEALAAAENNLIVASNGNQKIMQAKDDQIVSFANEIEDLKVQLDQVKKSNSIKDQECGGLKVESDTIKSQAAHLEKRLSDMRIEMENNTEKLSKTNAHYLAQINSLKEKILDLEEQGKSSKVEYLRQSTLLNNANVELEDRIKELQKAAKKSKDSSAIIANELREQLSIANENLSSLYQSKCNLESRFNESNSAYEKQVEELQKQLAYFEGSSTLVSKEKAQLEDTLDSFKKTLADLDTRLSSERGKFADKERVLQTEIKELQLANDEYSSKIDELNTALFQAEKFFENEKIEFQSKLASQNQAMSQKQEKLEHIESELKKTKRLESSLKLKILEIETAKKNDEFEFQRKLNAMTAEIENLDSNSKEYALLNAEGAKRLDTLTAHLQTSDYIISELKNLVIEQSNCLNSLLESDSIMNEMFFMQSIITADSEHYEQEVSLCQAELLECKSQLLISQNEVEILSSTHEKSNENHQLLNYLVTEYQNDSEKNMEEINTLRESLSKQCVANINITSKLDDQNTVIENLNASVRQEQQISASLRSLIQSLEIQLETKYHGWLNSEKQVFNFSKRLDMEIAEKENLYEKVALLQDKLMKAEAENQGTLEISQSLQDKVETLEIELDSKHNVILSHMEDVDAYEQKVKLKQSEVENQSVLIADLNNEKKRMENQMEKMKYAHDELQLQKQSFEEKCSDLKLELLKTKEIHREKETECSKTKFNLESVEMKLQQSNDQVTELKEMLRNMENQNTAKSRMIGELQEKISALDNCLFDERRHCKEISQELLQGKGQAASLSETISAKNQEIDLLAEEKNLLDETVTSLKANVIPALEERAKSAEEELRIERKQNQESQMRFVADLKNSSTNSSKLLKVIEEQNQSIEEKEAEIAEAQKKSRHYESELEIMKQKTKIEFAELSRKLSNLEIQSEKEAAEFEKTVQDLTCKIAEKGTNLRQLQIEKSLVDERISMIEHKSANELSNKDIKIKSLESKLQGQLETIEKLKKETIEKTELVESMQRSKEDSECKVETTIQPNEDIQDIKLAYEQKLEQVLEESDRYSILI